MLLGLLSPTAIHMSSYYSICVLVLYLCPSTTISRPRAGRRYMLLCIRPHTTIVSSCYYICVIINAGVNCSDTCKPSYYYMCPQTTISVCSYRPALCAAIRASASTAGIRVQRYKKIVKKKREKKRALLPHSCIACACLLHTHLASSE